MSHQPVGEPVGLFHTWWRGDPVPDLPPIPGLTIEPVDGGTLITALSWLDHGELRDRDRHGHQAYLARLGDEVIAWGWAAAATASIGELGITMTIPPGNRYLWDFVTLPEWRGRRIYPRLLQAVIFHEAWVERFWVGHDFSNVASARGIASAGFQQTGTLYRLLHGDFVLVPGEAPGASSASFDRVVASAALLGVPLAGFRHAGDA